MDHRQMNTDEYLSSDLEYLLESGQADHRLLSDSLVSQYFGFVYRLAVALLDDHEAAAYAALKTVITAILSVYRYKPHIGVEAWLIRLALDTCRGIWRGLKLRRMLKASLPLPQHPQVFGASEPSSESDAALWLAFDALPGRQRQPLLLACLLDMQPESIARCLGLSENEVITRLRSAHRRLLRSLSGSTVDLGSEGLGETLRQSLARRWPLPQIPSDDLEAIAAEVQRQAAEQSKRRLRSASIKEIILLGVAILIVIGIIRGANFLSPEPEITRLPQVAGSRSTPTLSASPTPTPFTVNYHVDRPILLEEIAERFDVPLETLVEANKWNYSLANSLSDGKQLQPGESLRIPLASLWGTLGTPTPVSTVVPVLPPLNIHSSPEEVRAALARSSEAWRTLWANIVVFNYGPPGYVGPPATNRVQVWVGKPERMLWINAGDHDRVYVGLILEDIQFSFYGNEVQASVLHKPGGRNPYLFDPFSPDLSEWFQGGGELQVLGQDTQAGREVLVVQWTAEEAPESSSGESTTVLILNVDTQTGSILHLRRYLGKVTPLDWNASVLVEEQIVTDIAYDVDFPPPDPFDPRTALKAGLVEDYHGEPLAAGALLPVPELPAAGHEPLPFNLPPPGFDPSGSRLTFQLPKSLKSLDGTLQQALPPVELFAGPYFLRSLRGVNPWSLACGRSPDGRWLAYAIPEWSLPADASQRDSLVGLHLLDLLQREEIQTDWSGLLVDDLDFSPDGQRLALSLSDSIGPQVWVIDLDSGDRDTQIYTSADSLVWSPDGQYLAFLGNYHLAGSSEPTQESVGLLPTEQAIVIRVDSGEVVYRASLPEDWRLYTGAGLESQLPQDWPVRDWDVPFPVYRYNVSACVDRP